MNSSERARRTIGEIARRCSIDINMTEIDGIVDVFDAIDLCEEYDVPYDELDDVEDFKDRLTMHFQKKIRTESRKEEIEHIMVKAGYDDQNRRGRLLNVLKDMLDILHRESVDMGNETTNKRNSSFVEGLLAKEGTSENLEGDCEVRMGDLREKNCLVIVAGETSAGKSSVLNLLFDEDILPVHNNSSTSVITIIRYDKRKHARVRYKDGEPDKVFDLDENGLQDLHKIAFMKSAAERECHNIHEVHVYLPAPILKSGLVFIDTPGIGENEFLEKELINFISKNQILGFMYVVKTDNAGGVQQDRLLGLLKIILTKKRGSRMGPDSRLKFDPKAALFVCNRFDNVKASERDIVKKNVIEKLSACWPSFNESQALFFSTSKARRDVTVDEWYINDNYKQLLDGIRELFIQSMDRRIKSTFKWIENVLKRLVHHLKSVVKRLDYSDKELKENSEVAKAKLELLRQKSDSVIKELTAKLELDSKELCEKLKKSVVLPYCNMRLTSAWSASEIPDVDSGLGDWSWVRERIDQAFYDRLVNYVEEWNKDEHAIESIEEYMSYQVRYDLQLLEGELRSIEKEMDGEASSNDGHSNGNLSMSRGKPYSFSLSRKHSGSLPTSPGRLTLIPAEGKLPLKLAGKFMKPFTNIREVIKSRGKLKEYSHDPVKVASEYAVELYKAMVSGIGDEDVVLPSLIDCLMDRPREYIAAIRRKIPDMILANELSCNMFEESFETMKEYHGEYAEMMTCIESLKTSLMEYGEGYIFVNDFAKDEIQIIKGVTAEGRRFSVAFNVTDFMRNSWGKGSAHFNEINGLWTVMYKGLLVRNGVEHPVGIRMYLPSSGIEQTFKEVAKLRCLTWQYTSIAEFLGIHDPDCSSSAFVYDGDLKSARRFLGGFCNKREGVASILEETACGLEYLHKKGLVHMELTQDTITVNEYGEVRLTGACLPRTANLPSEIESIATHNFVYLAPEVLRGNVYDESADIYSFGLLVLELAHRDVPSVFKRQRRMTLCDFIRTVNPEEMMDLEELVNIFTNKTRALIQNCLEMDKTDRPVMMEVAEYATYIRDERDALLSLPTRRSRPIIKRSSKAFTSM